MTEVDITERFFEASHKLTNGQIVALPDFSYLESMSAVELMDARLDSGLALMNLSYPEVNEVTESQVLSYLDTFILHLAQWLEGQSLPHTFYSSVFMHKSHSNPFIVALSQAGLFLAENLHQLIHSTGCLREDDYAYSALNFPECKFEDFENSLIKAEKTTNNEEILTRVKFVRGVCLVVCNLVKPDGITGAESYLAFALKNFSQIKGRENEDISAWFNKFFCLSRIPHFLPNKIYDVGKYGYERALDRISKFLEGIRFIIDMKDLADLEEITEKICNLPSFDNLSRAICEFLVFPAGELIYYFGKTHLSELIRRNMQKSGVDITFLLLSEDFVYYLSRVEIVLKECILLKLKNKTRQHRILGKYLSDFNILVSEAHFLVEKVYGKGNQKPERVLLLQWILQKTTQAMIDYLRLGFELDLYTEKDIGMVMFYMDFLLGVYINNVSLLIKHLGSKKNKNKNKKNDLKNLETDLKYYTGIQLLCRGIVRLYILLQKHNQPLTDAQESIRFNKRFRSFKSVQMPQFIEYSSYQSIKNLDLSSNDFANACKDCFDNARSSLSEIESLRAVKPILRVCVKNSLALSKCRKLDMACKFSFDYQETKAFPVFNVEPINRTNP